MNRATHYLILQAYLERLSGDQLIAAGVAMKHGQQTPEITAGLLLRNVSEHDLNNIASVVQNWEVFDDGQA